MARRQTVYLNGRFYAQPLSGVQRYAREIIAALDVLAGEGRLEQRYVLLTPPDQRDVGLAHIEQRRVGRLGGHGWEQVSFAAAVGDGVALSLTASGPVIRRRQLVVIHDAAIHRHPDHFSRPYVLLHRMLDAALARRARIATVSHFSQGELAETLRLDPAAIVVAPNGAEHLRIEPDVGVVGRLGLTDAPYFLTLGNLTRNKNLAAAVRAFDRLPRSGAKLVAVGRIDRVVFGADLPQASPDLLLPGRLSDAEVAGLMRGARALVFPSVYEGFGIPPLEAMVNDCPVLASSAPAVREVCGDAADYFDPHDDAALARLMDRVLNDDDGWRATRIAAGRERTRLFSWRRSAETLAQACAALA